MDEERGIYREEVLVMMGALADIQADTGEIIRLLRGEEDDDEEMDS